MVQQKIAEADAAEKAKVAKVSILVVNSLYMQLTNKLTHYVFPIA